MRALPVTLTAVALRASVTSSYNSVDEAIKDMLERIKKVWSERSKPKVCK